MIRHGEPIRVDGAIGPADPPLSQRGQLQATLLGEYLREEKLQAVYSSPLLRAGQTADAVASGFGLEVVTNEALAEFDRTSDTYIPIEELRESRNELWQAMANDDFSAWGVDMERFRSEVVDTVESIIASHPRGRIAAVCHGGVINAYLGHILGISRNSFFTPDYTSINRVAASRSGVRSVLRLNEVGHLRGRDLLVSTV